MAVIYGWTYAVFHSNVGWDRGVEAVYNYWENYWANKVNTYIFNTPGTLLTDANEIAEIAALINQKMVMTNIYLKGDANETPMASGFYANPFALDFVGDPDDNGGMGSGDFVVLNKYKRLKGEEFARADSIRVGIDPENIHFPVGRRFY